MKKGIFGSWFKEFATLVLTQTVQAFLLAIVMTIIVSCLAESDQTGSAANAAGLLAIVALASFNKVELLVKNIFGVTSQYGPSMENGRGITAGGMLAWRGAMRLKDNFTKGREANRMIAEGEQGIRNLEAKNLDPNKGLNSGNEKTEEKEKLVNDTQNQIEEQVVKLKTMDDMTSLTQAIRDLTAETRRANTDKTQDKLKEYKDMIQKGQDQKKAAVLENVGATIGAGAGAIVGLAQGDDIAKTTLAGAGAGDALGEGIAKMGSAKKRHVEKMNEMIDSYEESISKYNQGVMSNKYSMMKSGSSTADIEKYAQDARKQYQDNLKNAKASIEKASVKKSIRDNINDSRELNKRLKSIQSEIDKQTKAGN